MPRLRRRHIEGRPAQVLFLFDLDRSLVGIARNIAMVCDVHWLRTAQFEAYLQVLFWEALVFRACLRFCYHTINSNEVTVDFCHCFSFM